MLCVLQSLGYVTQLVELFSTNEIWECVQAVGWMEALRCQVMGKDAVWVYCIIVVYG